MTKAISSVILTRVSTREQEEGYSIDAQIHRLQEYCKRKNLRVIETFKIIESSTICHRKQFMEIIKFAKKQKEPIAIVADKVDRIQRSFQEYPILDPLIKEGKIELHFNTEGYVIHKDSISQERLMWSIGVVMAQSYVDSMRDNINRAIAQKLRNGEWISKAPIGYKNIRKEGGRGDIVIDQERAPLVRQLFEYYATGNYSMLEMMRYARSIGLRNSAGKQKDLTKSHIHKMLQNPFYHGIMRIESMKQELPHRYEPIIDRNLFDHCQEVMHGRTRNRSCYRGKDFVFRGMLRCAVTDRMITAETHTKKYANGNTGQWTYLAAFNPKEPTKKLWVREDEILAEVESILEKMSVKNEAILNNIMQYIRKSHLEKKLYHREQTATLKNEHTQIEDKIDTLVDLLMDKVIDKEEFEVKKKRLKDRQYQIDDLIRSFDEADDAFNEKLLNLVELAARAISHFKGSDITRKRELLNFIFQNLRLRGKKLEYTMRSPFKEFAEASKIEEWSGR